MGHLAQCSVEHADLQQFKQRYNVVQCSSNNSDKGEDWDWHNR